MPELPEVETVRRDLLKHLIGAVFQDIKIINFKNVAPRAAFLAKFLQAKKIKDISRRGKLLIVQLEAVKDFPYLLFHLKMTGQLIYQDNKSSLFGGHSLSNQSFEAAVGGSLPNKFTRAYFSFKQGGFLFFNDLRKFGYIKLASASQLQEILANNYGPEPLEKEFNLEYLTQILKNKTAPIKAVILNQKLIAGLGNIYADEALFRSQIKPWRQAKSLSLSERKKLLEVIREVIKAAIKARGTTFRNFVDARGEKGNFMQQLQVYQRQGQLCLVCGDVILKKKIAGRGTHYCPTCQK